MGGFWGTFVLSCPATFSVLLPAAVLVVVDLLGGHEGASEEPGTMLEPLRFSSVQGSHLLPDGDLGLQLGDAVLHRLLAVLAVWRGDRHDNAGLAHLHPPGEQMYELDGC